MSTRAGRTVTRVITTAAAMAVGAAVVTHGSAQALQPLSTAQLAAAGCAGETAQTRMVERGLVISGLHGSCAGIDVQAALTGSFATGVVTVSGRLHPVPGTRDLLLSLPASMGGFAVREVRLAFTDTTVSG